jgi:hypothetical protein
LPALNFRLPPSKTLTYFAATARQRRYPPNPLEGMENCVPGEEKTGEGPAELNTAG